MNSELRNIIDGIKIRWSLAKTAKSGWLTTTVSRFSLAVPFFLQAIDQLMKYAAKLQIEGIAKKAIVMEALGELYDTIISPLFPFWLAPWNGTIKQLVLDVMVSSFIDFLVGRLREGKLV